MSSTQSTQLCLGLATLPVPATFDEGVQKVVDSLRAAAAGGADIVCLPEAYLPGLRGQDLPVPDPDQARQERALSTICAAAKAEGVAAIIGMEWESASGLHNAAMVVSSTGEILGYQAKNQIPLEEEGFYVPDGKRRLFTVKGVSFGVAICHEGWRYPETVRWAAMRGAKIVFHPHLVGSNEDEMPPRQWGDPSAPYYEKAMVSRAVENAIYFASVNYAFHDQDAATSLISPTGECLAYMPYGEEGMLIYEIDVSLATGLYAHRYDPRLYPSRARKPRSLQLRG